MINYIIAFRCEYIVLCWNFLWEVSTQRRENYNKCDQTIRVCSSERIFLLFITAHT